jgi:hypothetical protein
LIGTTGHRILSSFSINFKPDRSGASPGSPAPQSRSTLARQLAPAARTTSE